MKRWLTGLFTAFVAVFLWANSTFAADTLPQKQGVITDQAHLFSAQQTQKIEHALAQDHYHFYVLTVAKQQNFSQYCNQVFNAWGMGGNDVLLVIDVGDRQVQLVAEKGTQLDNIIRGREHGSTVADKYRAVTDAYFVPDARQGDFTSAVIQTTNALNRLQPMSRVVLPYILVLLILLVLVVWLIAFYVKRRNRARLAEQLERTKDSLTEILTYCIDTESQLREKLIFVRGDEKTLLQTQLDRIGEKLPRLNEIGSELKASKISLYHVYRLEDEIFEISQYIRSGQTKVDTKASQPPHSDNPSNAQPNQTVIVENGGSSFFEGMLVADVLDSMFDRQDDEDRRMGWNSPMSSDGSDFDDGGSDWGGDVDSGGSDWDGNDDNSGGGSDW